MKRGSKKYGSVNIRKIIEKKKGGKNEKEEKKKNG